MKYFRNMSDLLRLQVTDNRVNVVQYLIDEGHHLSHLNLDKMTATFLCNLDEGVTSHVLHTIVGFCVIKEDGKSLGRTPLKPCIINL